MIVKHGGEICRAIISERSRQNMPIKTLAEKSGVPYTTIKDILYRPELKPALRTCLPVLRALGLEMVIVRRKQTDGGGET